MRRAGCDFFLSGLELKTRGCWTMLLVYQVRSLILVENHNLVVTWGDQ